ncbi:MAG: T9SS type A sorting domain-containing protein [Balneola sp.]|nr:T9SS type A sorting domain-containing protein [Balneola sp.]MBO6650539.1 T9SS type A sorting domain-containing protein [Balneola sp.]MBO6711536.1 T9SS type A sorting domain-containing protein [Balneola sp.]MBO6799732.1 T9SS type A sorting domain-containing protein [Balneola sp.]MBO6870827.1 T9SS type A sorting domain-containing protein [Balneola sp.]
MRCLLLFSLFTLYSTMSVAQIDYSSEIAPILSGKCDSCHSSGSNGFDSSPYDDLIASTSPANRYNKKHIIPNDAAGSPLVDKIEANPDFGSRMPQGGQLTIEEINKIKQWINEGANEQVQTSNEIVTDYPDKFELLGNYPNPFNPSTVVQFRSPVSSEFKITVYNANGQQVNSLVGRAVVGQNDFSVNLTDQPSGVYFYRIRVISNVSSSMIGSGKMTLIK